MFRRRGPGASAGLETAALIDLCQGTVDQGGLEALTAGHLTHAAAVADLNLLAYGLVRAKRAG
ncbi:hypothetical protein ABT147_20405 [Streptomyces sp. NPDC001868]|uniref:hypothetical protein n=1 Tax=Streptomyces sp. NPDC001868 TaxID=3154401 RepID=UPI00333431AE